MDSGKPKWPLLWARSHQCSTPGKQTGQTGAWEGKLTETGNSFLPGPVSFLCVCTVDRDRRREQARVQGTVHDGPDSPNCQMCPTAFFCR